jgi:flagellar biogenesis protein FliO
MMRSFVAVVAVVAYIIIPAWILWKFYQVLSRIADNLAGIRQTLGNRPQA